VRHRLNRGGNWQLNRALHIVAITQIRRATDGDVYYQRKLDERKPRRSLLRSLRRMGRGDSRNPSQPPPAG
jgi:transposase